MIDFNIITKCLVGGSSNCRTQKKKAKLMDGN